MLSLILILKWISNRCTTWLRLEIKNIAVCFLHSILRTRNNTFKPPYSNISRTYLETHLENWYALNAHNFPVGVRQYRYANLYETLRRKVFTKYDFGSFSHVVYTQLVKHNTLGIYFKYAVISVPGKFPIFIFYTSHFESYTKTLRHLPSQSEYDFDISTIDVSLIVS